jgi:hypothetical protein
MRRADPQGRAVAEHDLDDTVMRHRRMMNLANGDGRHAAVIDAEDEVAHRK